MGCRDSCGSLFWISCRVCYSLSDLDSYLSHKIRSRRYVISVHLHNKCRLGPNNYFTSSFLWLEKVSLLCDDVFFLIVSGAFLLCWRPESYPVGLFLHPLLSWLTTSSQLILLVLLRLCCRPLTSPYRLVEQISYVLTQ